MDLDIETLDGALTNWNTRMMTRSEFSEYIDNIAMMKFEREAEGAYERHLDYLAWLRDGWQPEHAF